MRQTWEYDGDRVSGGAARGGGDQSRLSQSRADSRHLWLLHARCDERGDLAVGITGIYYYYRQFGYEYALDLGGSRRIPISAIPALASGATEPYTLRAATLDDLPRVMALYDRERTRAFVSAAIDEPTWRWIIAGMHPDTDENWLTQLILDSDRRSSAMC